PPCLVYHLTGLYCPGCGSSRAVHALLDGDLRLALRNNAVIVIAAPLVAAGFVVWTVQRVRGRPTDLWPPQRVVMTLFVLVMAYTVAATSRRCGSSPRPPWWERELAGSRPSTPTTPGADPVTRTGTVLDEIIAGVLEDLEPRRARRSQHDLEQLVAAAAPARDAHGALSADESSMGLIAEGKRSSPSKGSLAPAPEPRPRRPRRDLRRPRCERHHRAHRAPSLRRVPRRPRRRPRTGRRAGAAQGLRGRPLPGARGPCPRRRSGAADRRRPRRHA